MNTKHYTSILMVLVLTCSAFAFTGTLTSADGGLEGTGFWVTDNGEELWTPAVITWNVTENLDATWHYEYTLEVFRADVSHFLVETSATFGPENLFNAQFPGTEIEIQNFTQANGNPFLPADIYGAKFDSTQGTAITIAFDSDRNPVWGDFYAKCGAVGGTQNTVWNAGFLTEDPTDPAADGTIANHILVPNTVPEPATIAMLAIGALLAFKRRR